MSLVGASRFSIRIPYLIEGAIYGFAGGLLASALLIAAHRVIELRLMEATALGRLPLFPVAETLVVLCAAGVLYGVVCSYIAVLVPMKP
jgi:cell division transport system permease protein